MISALQGMVRISRGVQVLHTVRAGRGKSRAVQLIERPCQRATQVVSSGFAWRRGKPGLAPPKRATTAAISVPYRRQLESMGPC
jgi:hypothetical protein